MLAFKNAVALLRGYWARGLKKAFHPASFSCGATIRIFNGVVLTLRDKGKIRFGKRVKIDARAVVASNGGEIIVGDNVGIGRNNMIVSLEKITIGDGTTLAPNVLIYDHDHEFDAQTGVKQREYRRSPVVIGKNCWIGANTVILRGTVLGDNCLVGAGCVLKGVFPNGSKIVQKRETTVIAEDKQR